MGRGETWFSHWQHSFQRLVSQLGKIIYDRDCEAGHVLQHDQAIQLLGRVDPPVGLERTPAPAEPAPPNQAGGIAPGEARPPPPRPKPLANSPIGWMPAGRWFCSIHSTVLRPKQAHPVQFAAVQQHLAEAGSSRTAVETSPPPPKGLRVGCVISPPPRGSMTFSPPPSAVP